MKHATHALKEATSDEPIEIVRLKDLPQYVPLKKTRLGDLIDAGMFEIVPLTPPTKDGRPGRAKGVTMRSIRRYQAVVMGLTEKAEDAAADN